MSTSKLNRVAVVSAIALAFSAPTFAQTSGGTAADSGGQTKAGPTATTGTTSATPAAPGTTGATGSKATKSGSASENARAGGAASGAASNDTTRGAPDNTNSKVRTGASADVNTWAKGYAGEHQGRISRQAYIDEIARRWDSMDRSNQGLTPVEVSRLTGKVDVDHSALPRTGSDVQSGNMGPSSVKGK